eukprot:227420_1
MTTAVSVAENMQQDILNKEPMKSAKDINGKIEEKQIEEKNLSDQEQEKMEQNDDNDDSNENEVYSNHVEDNGHPIINDDGDEQDMNQNEMDNTETLELEKQLQAKMELIDNMTPKIEEYNKLINKNKT